MSEKPKCFGRMWGPRTVECVGCAITLDCKEEFIEMPDNAQIVRVEKREPVPHDVPTFQERYTVYRGCKIYFPDVTNDKYGANKAEAMLCQRCGANIDDKVPSCSECGYSAPGKSMSYQVISPVAHWTYENSFNTLQDAMNYIDKIGRDTK